MWKNPVLKKKCLPSMYYCMTLSCGKAETVLQIVFIWIHTYFSLQMINRKKSSEFKQTRFVKVYTKIKSGSV